MPELRILDRITRQMQRLGYLKYLVRRVTSTSTSSLDNLGYDLIEIVTRKIRVPLNRQRANYIKLRLYDRAYNSLKKQTDKWIQSEEDSEPPIVMMELQDLYLADSRISSGVGKLVHNDWNKYPRLGVNLGLIKDGTYSATTRALSLLSLIPDFELKAFQEYSVDINPLRLSKPQSLLLLYSLLENDGEVLAPFWSQLPRKGSFNDRDAGDFLPVIYREIVTRHRRRTLSVDAKERLYAIEKSANSIARQRNSEGYKGGSSREHASRPRIEPFVDIGLFSKPKPLRYEYEFTDTGISWADSLKAFRTTQEISDFLETCFFKSAAKGWNITAQSISSPEIILPLLYSSWKSIASSSGYAPIAEIALVAGIKALINQETIIEINDSREVLINYQKTNPYQIRFTVDRMGKLAHTRFLQPPVFLE